MTIYKVKADMINVQEELKNINEQLAKGAADVTFDSKGLQSLRTQKVDLQARYDILKEQLEEMQAVQQSSLQNPEPKVTEGDEKTKAIHAKAELIRSAMKGKPISQDVFATLGDNDPTTSGGENILPTSMVREIVHEPFVKNPIRDIIPITSITNLELPKIEFTLSDSDFIQDTETAKELEASGGQIQFNRNKFKVFAGVSETILGAADADVVGVVEAALASGLATREKLQLFEVGSQTNHMSFYQIDASSDYLSPEITSTDLYEGILEAIADLPETFRDGARVVMTYKDYLSIIKKLSNGTTNFFGVQPEQIIGKPVIFSDLAVKPIVGDFRYLHGNYDPKIGFERDKDIKTGIEQFCLTVHLDFRFKLRSAFRIVTVTP